VHDKTLTFLLHNSGKGFTWKLQTYLLMQQVKNSPHHSEPTDRVIGNKEAGKAMDVILREQQNREFNQRFYRTQLWLEPEKK